MNDTRSYLNRFLRSMLDFGIPATVALIGYVLSRVYRLTDYPLYFMCDEAVMAVRALDLLDGHGTVRGIFLPTYFDGHGFYNISTSVYAQVIPQALFYPSFYVTRLVSALISILTGVTLALWLKNIYQARFWWMGIFLFALAPVWFLHSRTNFELVEAISFYAPTAYCYAMYRAGHLKYLIPACFFAGLCFYSFASAPIIIPATGLLLLAVDFKHHWKSRKTFGISLLVVLFFVVAYIRFKIAFPFSHMARLHAMNSYWFQEISTLQKLAVFGKQWLESLDPRYWFLEPIYENPRHFIVGYARLNAWMFPLALIGIGRCIVRFRDANYRLPILLLLTSTLGSAVSEVGISRSLMFLIPCLALVALGFEWCMEKVLKFVPKLTKFSTPVIVVGFSVLLCTFTLRVLKAAPLETQNYGLYGVQYGGEPVFKMARKLAEQNPQKQIRVSGVWGNSIDTLLQYYVRDRSNIRMGLVREVVDNYYPEIDKLIFITTVDEYRRARESGKFNQPQLLDQILYPNGSVGFLAVQLSYVDGVAQIFERERLERLKPVHVMVPTNQGELFVDHTVQDIGTIYDLFDDNPKSVMRGRELNPFVLDFKFSNSAPLTKIDLNLFYSQSNVTLSTKDKKGNWKPQKTLSLTTNADHPLATFEFNPPLEAESYRLEIFYRDRPPTGPANIHLYDLKLTTTRGLVKWIHPRN